MGHKWKSFGKKNRQWILNLFCHWTTVKTAVEVDFTKYKCHEPWQYKSNHILKVRRQSSCWWLGITDLTLSLWRYGFNPWPGDPLLLKLQCRCQRCSSDPVLPWLWHRPQLQLTFNPSPGTSMCPSAALKKKSRGKGKTKTDFLLPSFPPSLLPSFSKGIG